MFWSLEFGKGFLIEFLVCGIYFNIVFGYEFWVYEFSCYLEGYYGFLFKICIYIFLG